MEVRPSSPGKLIFRLQEPAYADLDVAAAYAKRPVEVRTALLDAICQVQLSTPEVLLFRLVHVFRSALQRPWKEPRALRPVLEACYSGTIDADTEQLFFEHGKEYGVIALALATYPDPKLFSDIESLPQEEQVRLVKNVVKLPKPIAITAYEQTFKELPRKLVLNPPPRLKRPRNRYHNETEEYATLVKNLEAWTPKVSHPESSNNNSRNKKRKSGPTKDTINQSQQLPPHETQVSSPPTIHASHSPSLVLPKLPPIQYVSLPQPDLSSRNFSEAPRKPGLSHGIHLSESTMDTGRQHLPPQQLQPGQDEGWHVPFTFTTGRPLGLAQSEIQEEEWALPPGFVIERPPVFPQHEMSVHGGMWNASPELISTFRTQVQIEEEAWDVPQGFIPGRPPAFSRHSQMAAEEGWDVPADFIPGRPPVFHPLQLQLQGQ